MEPNLEITVPELFIVAHDVQIGNELVATLSPYFKVKAFNDVRAAIDALEHADPDVIIAENDIPPKSGINMLLAEASDEHHKAGFLLVRKEDKEFSVSLNETRQPGRYLTWPFQTKKLMDTITALINEKAEKAWDDLPETQQKSLKLTVEEYQGIAAKIAAGEPIQYDTAAKSCLPLVEAITLGDHHALLKNVQSHHNYTYVHSMRMATLLTLFGHGIGVRGDDLLVLSTGGLLHDVGKIVTPFEILDKPGKLSEEEWPVMRNHVVESGNLLNAGDDVTKGAKIIAEQHHEKIDGTGYPKGLKGAEMNELARMCSIVDIFSALTDQRSYKPAYTPAKSFTILKSMGTAIDQDLLILFKDMFGGDEASGL